MPGKQLERPADWPGELEFLLQKQCNPLLPGETEDNFDEEGGGLAPAPRARPAWQRISRCISESAIFQVIVFLAVIVDVTVTIWVLSVEEDHDLEDAFLLCNWFVVVILVLDVLLRLGNQQKRFFRSKMNLFEALLALLSLIETIITEIDLPLPFFRLMRPVFRGVRLIRILTRTLGKSADYIRELRHHVSGDRVRYTQSGYDLDLAYITSQVIAMSSPCSGVQALFGNPATELAHFFNTKHPNKYLIVNLTDKLDYPPELFNYRILQFPIGQHGVPSLDGISRLCIVLERWLQDPAAVVAFHTPHCHGRICFAIAALLLHKGAFPSVESVIAHLEHIRAAPDKGADLKIPTFDNPSQVRFLHYYHSIITQQEIPIAHKRQAELKRIKITGLAQMDLLEFKVLHHPGVRPGEDGKLPLLNKFTVVEEEELTKTGSNARIEEDGVMKVFAKAVLEHGLTKLRNMVQSFVAEGDADSAVYGTKPMSVTPDFALTAANLSESTDKDTPDILKPGLWRCNENHLDQEIRIEVYRRELVKKTLREKGRSFFSSTRSRSKSEMEGDEETGDTDATMVSKLIFAVSVHCGYLELDETTDISDHLEGGKSCMPAFDKMQVDKASGAIAPKDFPASFKVQLVFAVDERYHQRDKPSFNNIYFPSRFSPDRTDEFDLGWLTWCMGRLWPFFRESLEELLQDSVFANIKESLPGPLKNIVLEKCSLGEGYPVFGKIHASSRRIHEAELQLDFPIDIITNADIVLNAGFASFGVSNLVVKGNLSVKLTPISNKLPCLLGCEIMFLSPPVIDFQFANFLEFANWSSVHNAIFGAISGSICDLMVLPNIMSINWGDINNDDSFRFTSLLPSGMIRLGVMEARNIGRHSNHFVVPSVKVSVSMNDQHAETRSIEHDPSILIWQEYFDLLVFDEAQPICIDVVNHDLMGSNHIVGSSKLPTVAQVVAAGPAGLRVSLETTNGVIVPGSSEIVLSAKLFHLATSSTEFVAKHPGWLGTGALTSHSTSRIISPAIQQSRAKANMPALAEGDEPVASEIPRSVPMAKSKKGSGNHSWFNCCTKVEAAKDSEKVVCLLAVDFLGGDIPTALGAPDGIQVKTQVGEKQDTNFAQEAAEVDPGMLSEKAMHAVKELKALGIEPTTIADILKEELADVQRVVHKAGVNFDVPHKAYLMLTEKDMLDHSTIHFVVQKGSKDIASGKVSLFKLSRAHGMYLKEMVDCRPADKAHSLKLWVKLHLFDLTEVEDYKQKEGLMSNPDSEQPVPVAPPPPPPSSPPRPASRSGDSGQSKESDLRV